MRLFLIISLLFVCPSFVFSQSNSFEFTGLIQVEKQKISYIIKFDFIHNNSIEGYSITDIEGENYTKSKIKGTYDTIKQIISFEEIKILQTKSKEQISDFCFIHIKNANVKKNDGFLYFNSPFIGFYTDGSKCAQGKIYMQSDIKKLIEKLSEHIKKMPIDIPQQLDGSALTHVETNDTIINLWESDSIVFQIWDGEFEDGDIVSIYINNDTLLDKYVIKNKRKTIKYACTEGVYTIKIVAIDEGSYPPNSARIVFIDNKKKYEVLSNLKKNEEVIFKFIKL